MDGVAYPSTNGNGTAVHDDTSAPAFDPSVFRSYLLPLLPPLFGATPSDLSSLLDADDFDERVGRFAGEGGGALYAIKHLDSPSSDEEEEPPVHAYELASQLTYT